MDLYAAEVTDAGLKGLARLKSLQRVDLYGTDVTDAGVEELHKAIFPVRDRRIAAASAA